MLVFFLFSSVWAWSRNHNNTGKYRLRFNNFVFDTLALMESMFESYLGAGGAIDAALEPDDIPKGTQDPVWILGRKYCALQELDLIRRDVQSRLWCTYRRGFVPLGESQLTSDRGWGCTLRCGQMVLAQSLIDLHLGRDWYWTSATRDPTYLKIVNRFEDNRKSPFSLHQIALMGDSEERKVGQWFGPNTVAQVIKKLVPYDEWCSLAIHVALDNSVATDEIDELCTDKLDGSWKPLLLIVPLRLGLTEINSIYFSSLKKCFEISTSVGMIGGRPNQALYFIGYVGEDALFLDPHTTQKSGSVGNKTTESEVEMDETFHIKYASRISFSAMDPSSAVCFLCRTRNEFQEFCTFFKTLELEHQPLFEIVATRQMPWTSMKSTQLGLDSIQSLELDEEMDDTMQNDSDDGFEIIA